jgi:hypothetical protein
MQYMLFVCTDSEPDASDEPLPDIEAWVKEGDRRGIRLQGDRLQPPSDATTLRIRDGETLLTDGPFVETREWIAGYDILECNDLDEAIEFAARHPMARAGRIEIRPFWNGID